MSGIDLSNQMSYSGLPPIMNQRGAMYTNLQGYYGISGQGPMGMPAFSGIPSMGGQLSQFMGQQFGPIGQGLSPFLLDAIKSLVGVNLSSLQGFGTMQSPGEFLLNQTSTAAGMPQFAPVAYQDKTYEQLETLSKNNNLLGSLFSLTTGITKGTLENLSTDPNKWNKEQRDALTESAQTAAELTNYLRSPDPLARMLAQGVLEPLGVPDEYGVVPGATSVANQFLGRARYMRGTIGQERVPFSQFLAEGLIERVDAEGSRLDKVGYRDSADALRTLGASRLLNVGDLNMSTSLDRRGIDELRRRAIDQVEEIGSILEVGKELGLKVDQTLTAFQAFTGGKLPDKLRKAEEDALLDLPAGADRDTRDRAVSVARAAEADQIANQFKDAQLRAQLAGTDMAQILSLSTAGATSLERKLGVKGLSPAMTEVVLGLTEASFGLGVGDSEIAEMATAYTETAIRSREGRAAAVLFGQIESGLLDETDPAVKKLVDKYNTTGQISNHEVAGLLEATGMSKIDLDRAFMDSGVRYALSLPGVGEAVVLGQRKNEKMNLTGGLKEYIQEIGGAGSEDLLLDALQSGKGIQYIKDYAEENDIDPDTLEQLQHQFLKLRFRAGTMETADFRITDIRNLLRWERTDPDVAKKQAAAARRFSDVLTTLSEKAPLASELGKQFIDDLKGTAAYKELSPEEQAKAREAERVRATLTATDDVRTQQEIDRLWGLHEEAGTDKEKETISKRIEALKTARDTPSTFDKDALTRLGTAMSLLQKGDSTASEIIQNVLGGTDREELRGIILSTLGRRDEKGNLVGLTKNPLIREELGIKTPEDEQLMFQLLESLNQVAPPPPPPKSPPDNQPDPETTEPKPDKDADKGAGGSDKGKSGVSEDTAVAFGDAVDKLTAAADVVATLVSSDAVIRVFETNEHAFPATPPAVDGNQDA